MQKMNRKHNDYIALAELRGFLRDRVEREPHPQRDNFKYAVLLASNDDLAAYLKTTPDKAHAIMARLCQWGYVKPLRMVNVGLRRVGRAYLFGRLSCRSPRHMRISFLEPPCRIPTSVEYRCPAWTDDHISASWANGPGAYDSIPWYDMYWPVDVAGWKDAAKPKSPFALPPTTVSKTEMLRPYEATGDSSLSAVCNPLSTKGRKVTGDSYITDEGQEPSGTR